MVVKLEHWPELVSLCVFVSARASSSCCLACRVSSLNDTNSNKCLSHAFSVFLSVYYGSRQRYMNKHLLTTLAGQLSLISPVTFTFTCASIHSTSFINWSQQTTTTKTKTKSGNDNKPRLCLPARDLFYATLALCDLQVQELSGKRETCEQATGKTTLQPS